MNISALLHFPGRAAKRKPGYVSSRQTRRCSQSPHPSPLPSDGKGNRNRGDVMFIFSCASRFLIPSPIRWERVRVKAILLTLVLFAGALAHNIEGASTDFTLYVANYLAYGGGSVGTRYYAIEEFDSFGQASSFVTNTSFNNPVLSAPIAVALDAANNVYVTCSQDGTWIEKFDPWGNNAVQFTSLGGAQGNGMTFDAAGNLYLAYGRFGGVYVYSHSGTQGIFTNGLTLVDLVDLVFDSARNLYVSDEQNGVILKFDPQTNMTTFASPCNAPYGL